jgi:hypothetical protein
MSPIWKEESGGRRRLQPPFALRRAARVQAKDLEVVSERRRRPKSPFGPFAVPIAEVTQSGVLSWRRRSGS